MFFTSKYFPRLIEGLDDIVAYFSSLEIFTDSSDIRRLSEEVGSSGSSINTI